MPNSLPLTPSGASAAPATPARVAGRPSAPAGQSFADTLRDVRFSLHAQRRLTARNIPLNDQAVSRIEQGVELAERKGIRESLVLLDDLAFLVNVKNRTVITVVDAAANRGGVFTNIDGAVIV